MEERRKEARVRAELRVEVSGSDARSAGFRDIVLATSLSHSGALLTNVHAELRCGDLLAIEFAGSFDELCNPPQRQLHATGAP